MFFKKISYVYCMKRIRETLVIAVDGGGSRSRARLYRLSGDILGEAEGKSANIFTNLDDSIHNLVSTINQAYASAGVDASSISSDIAYMGLAGANIDSGAHRLKKKLGFRHTQIVSDREITIFGALGNEDGAVALVGTGSFFSVRINGELHNVGGWGFQLSDDCSGAYLGRKILRATVAAYDGLAEGSELTYEILEKFGGKPKELVSFIQNATPSDYGKFVPQLVTAQKSGDPVACSILSEAANRMVYIFDAIGVQISGKLCLMGGVGSTYSTLLPERYRNIQAEPNGSGLDGAFALAKQELMEATA